MPEFDIDVSGIDKTLNAIKRDLHRGMEKSVETLVGNAKNHARKVITENNAIFNSEVYRGFRDAETKNTPYNVRAKLYNDVEHAEVLEEGAVFPTEGPPVEALLPWVARKMNVGSSFDPDSYGGGDGFPDSFDNDDEDDGDDGGSTNKPTTNEEITGENYTDLPLDWEKAQDVPVGAILISSLGNAPIRKIDNSKGLIFGWNNNNHRISPKDTFDEYVKIDGKWNYKGSSKTPTYIVPDDPVSVLGYKRGTSEPYNFDFYRKSDLPDVVSSDFKESSLDEISDWKNRIGQKIAYRDKDGIIHEGEVIKVENNQVIFKDKFTNESYFYNPSKNKLKVVGIERIDLSKNNPLYNVSGDKIQKGEEVFVSTTSINRLTVETKGADYFVAKEDGQDYYYDDILSTVDGGPVAERIDNFKEGDRVTFYDTQDDTFRDIILNGDISLVNGTSYGAVDEETKVYIGEIPQALFVEWESEPGFNRTKFSSNMREFSVTSSVEGKDESLYTGQEVVLYDTISNKTRKGKISTTAWKSNFEVTFTDGNKETVDIDTKNWEIVGGVDFSSLTETQQKSTIDEHINKNVDVLLDSDTENSIPDDYTDFVKKQLKNSVYEGYSDKDRFSQVLSSWTELTYSSATAHVSESSDDGWELQMYPNPNGTPNDLLDWQRALGHEFGHALDRPTPASVSIFVKDPESYAFSSVWRDRKNPANTNFEHGLPKWEFGTKDPSHGYKEMYMFTEDDATSKISYNSNGDIKLDKRNELNPYGISEWGEHVQELATAKANQKNLAKQKMDTTVKELRDKQVFGKDKIDLEEDDYVALEVDGKQNIHKYKGRTNTKETFSENSNEDVPVKAEPILFNDMEGTTQRLYLGDDGTVYGTKFENSEYYLTKEGDSFIGKASVTNYDPSLNEFPELTESDNIKRLQESANMAWWYMVNYIENDSSRQKNRSVEIVPDTGYSTTYAGEVTTKFTEALTHPNPNYGHIESIKTVADEYPFFIEEFLKEREPVSQRAAEVLETWGFNV